MNKLRFMPLFLLAFIITPKTYCGKLKTAMNSLDVNEVKSLLEKKGNISEATKKRLINLFNPTLQAYEAESSGALDNVSNISSAILHSGITLASICLAGAGIYAIKGIDAKLATKLKTTSIFSPITQKIFENRQNEIAAGSASLLLGLGILAYEIKKLSDKNHFCKAALNFRKAIEIKNLIKKCPIKTV